MEYKKFSAFIDSVQYGYTATETSLTEGDAKYLRITDIVPYFVDKERVPFCRIDNKNKPKYIVKENDLLIARTGATTGYNLIVPKGFENYIFASYLVRFNYNQKELYPKYLKHVLKSQQYYGFVKNYIGGSAQPGMNPKTFGKFQVPYVEYSMQKRIADILSAYDDLIENNNRRIALLEKAAQELYKEWFVRFRFPGYETVDFEEKKPFGWIVSSRENSNIPSCYNYCEFSELGSFTRGRNITAAEMVEGEIPVISAGLQPSGYHNKANVIGRSLTVSASGANAGYLQYNLSDIWAADCSYYQNDNNLWFVYCTLKFLQPVISNLQCGAAQPHVYPKNINKLCVLKPTDELITKFNDTVEEFFKEIEILQKKNDNLVKQRDLLLPRLMGGKLEV